LSNKLEIRKALSSDVDLLFNWTNDDLVRKHSFSSELIPYESHCKWYQKKIKDENSMFFIVEEDKTPAGLVRFDIENGAATIGVSIDKGSRGKGLGGQIIALGVQSYFSEKELPILASIKNENVASIKSFKKAGFSFFKDDVINGVESVVYQLKKNDE
jgi:RimJ/RimL family protein N-acetyltransferase